MKKTICILCALLSALSLYSYEELSNKQALLDAEQPLLQEAPLKDYNPSKKVESTSRGPFVSSNTGLGFVFFGSSFVEKAPAYEALLGYQIANSLKVALSYQYQNVPLETSYRQDASILQDYINRIFQSGIRLQTGAIKVTSSLPSPFLLGLLRVTPYLSCGTGFGYAELVDVFGSVESVFIVDMGLALKVKSLSAQVGCKYNNWSWRGRFFSVIPYVGLQVNF